MIYEERYTTANLAATRDYMNFCREKMCPKMKAAGGQVICLLNGLIGDMGNAFLQITGFADLNTWQAAQDGLTADRDNLVESEQIRLLTSVASRPKQEIPQEDRRPCYSYRRLFMAPDDLGKFVKCSEEGVWPLYEAAECRILGLFTTLAATNPLELVLMTGYNGPGHWENTRINDWGIDGIDKQLWEQGQTALRERGPLSVRGSWVRLWHALDF